MCVRLGTDGWYYVTKDKMIFLLNVLVPLSCFQRVFQRGLDILNPVDLFLVKMLLKFFLYFLNIFLEEFVSSRRVSSFIKPFFSWPLIGGKMRSVYIEILKSVGLKCVSTPKNWRTFKPFPFVHNCIQKWDFVFRDFRFKFNRSVVINSLFNEVCYLFSSSIQEIEDVALYTFSNRLAL